MSNEEHDQNFITAIEFKGKWIDVKPGTLDLILDENGGVDFVVDRVIGGTVEGKLPEITGLRSFGGPDESEEN